MVAVVVGLVAACGGDDVVELPAIHPFTTHLTNPDCVPAPDLRTRDCDPINLAFPGRRADEIRDRFVRLGWRKTRDGGLQWVLTDDGRSLPQSLQLVLADGRLTRYHLRLWQLEGPYTVAAVHHEHGSGRHRIDRSWEAAERFVRAQLCRSDCRTATFDEAVKGRKPLIDWRGWANDGRVLVVAT